MGATGEIKAGSAYVELFAKDSSLHKGLDNAQKKLTAWGGAVTGMGGKLFAAGAALRAPFLAAVKVAADMGSELVGMRAKTGISIEALSALGYAAQVSGSDMESLGGGLAKMQKKIGEGLGRNVEKSIAAKDAFRDIGVSFSELKGLSPDKQFELIANKITSIEDPAKRAQAAISIFGKSGANLLPMMSGISDKLKEAQDAGLIIKTEDAEAAKAFAHILETVFLQLKRVAFGVGSALMPEMQGMLEIVSKVLRSVIDWVDANRPLISTIAKVGSVLMAAGAALVVVGGMLAGAGAIIGAISTALTGLGTVLGVVGGAFAFLVSPLGLVLAALTVGAVAWAKYTQSGQAVVAGFTKFFGDLFKTVKDTMGGIFDAIKGGNLALAGTIALAGLRVAMLQGVAALSGAIGGGFGDLIGKIGTQLASGDFAGAFRTAIESLSELWGFFTAGLMSGFATAAKAILDVWKNLEHKITDKLLAMASEDGPLGKLMQLVVGKTGVKEGRELEARRKALLEKSGQEYIPAEDPLAQTQAAARSQTDATANDLKAKLDSLDEAAKTRAQEAAEKFKQTTGYGAAGANVALEQAQAALAAALAAARDEASKEAEKKKDDLAAAGDEVVGERGKIQGTFSAAAAGMFGRGGDPAEKTAENTRLMLEEQKKTNKKLDTQGGLPAGNK